LAWEHEEEQQHWEQTGNTAHPAMLPPPLSARQ
jgi:hypothetical protein